MYKDKSGNCWYKVGLHVHTSLSDGKLSPEEVAARYKEAGFDAIAITDHWKYHCEDEISGLKIISGCEYNVGGVDAIQGVMHIVGVGMREEPALSKEKASRQQVIDEINACGGLAVLAHPAWSLNTIEDVKALRGFSMLEIYNTVSGVDQSIRPYSGYLVDVLANEGIVFPLTATDDAHFYDERDDAAKSYIMVKAKSIATEDILEAIKQKDFYATQGPELYVRRDGDTIIADCSECVLIKFVSNFAFVRPSALRGEKLTHFEYKVRDGEKWVRVEVLDEKGNYAWSNIIVV